MYQRSYGFPSFLQTSESQHSLFLQHPYIPPCPPHTSAIHSIQTTSNYMLIGSRNKLTIKPYLSSSSSKDITSTCIRSNPCADSYLVVGNNNLRYFDGTNELQNIYHRSPHDACFINENLVAVVSDMGTNLFDMNRGVLDGGIEVKGTSIGSDGFDIYIGGNEVVCCDIRTYKRKWDLTIQGNLTIGGGLGIVNGKNCVGFDLNGKVLWKTPRKNVSCLSMCSDGEFCVAGSLSGGVNIITATTGIDLVLLQSIHDGGVTALTWDEKMCSLVTGGEDGIVMNWSCDNVEENIKDSDEWD